MKEKAKVLDKDTLNRSLVRIAHEILEKNKGTAGLCLVGIRKRGVYLAQRLAGCLKKIEGNDIPVGILDITLYRDDLTLISSQPVVHKTEIDFNIDGKIVVLVDDVLYSGRTVRAALDALIDLGRPKAIKLAVLIDRLGREFPIQADFIGHKVDVALDKSVQVNFAESDGKDQVMIE